MSRNPKLLLKRLPLPPGSWQLFWYGSLTSAPQAIRTAYIYGFFAEVVLDDGEIIQRRGEVKRVVLPVSDMVAMPLGTVFDDLQIIHGLPLSIHCEEEEITVDFTRKNLELVARKNPLKGPRLLPLGKKSLLEDPEYEGWLVAADEGEHRAAYIFPSTVLFHFFWAHSSKWSQLMVDGRFVDYERYIFDPRCSHISGDYKTAKIWLRQWMLDQDAPFIASFGFDEYALEAGANIYLHLAQRGSGSINRCIRALPPFQGKLKLIVQCQRVMTPYGESRLIHSIKTCDYRSPIEHLSFDRDNDGRRLSDALIEGDVDKVPMKRESFGSPPEPLLAPTIELDNKPGSSEYPEVEVTLHQIRDRFPNLVSMRAEKLPQINTKYENLASAKKRWGLWVDQVSTLIDSSSSEDAAPKALFRAQLYKEAQGTDDTMPVTGDIRTLAEGLLRESFFEVKIGGTEWQVETALVPMPSLRGTFFTLPPQLFNGDVPKWLYRDRANQFRKRAICLAVTFTNDSEREWPATRYILDIEPRDGAAQNSILFFWNDLESPLKSETYTVRQLINSIVMQKGPKLPKSEMQKLNGRICPHPHPNRLSQFLENLYVSTNKMG